MSKAKWKWKSVSIPRRFLKRIRAILGFVADESIAEREVVTELEEETHIPKLLAFPLQYARQSIQKRLILDEIAFEEQKMLEKEIKERLKDWWKLH